jgi:hypothetical protein
MQPKWSSSRGGGGRARQLVPSVALRIFWYNKKERVITRLKGVITPEFLGKGKKSIDLETVVRFFCRNVFSF